jgi:DNA-binding PadR family transcriptional regulator
MTKNYQKETQTKLTKGLLDMIILQYLNQQSMHGYQVITKIRKDFGVNLGPSTIYPLMGLLEKKGHVQSTWNMDTERPRKMYALTNEGKNFLSFTQNTLTLICKCINVVAENKTQIQTAPINPIRLTLQRGNPLQPTC